VRIVWREAAGKFRFVANGEVRDVFYPVGITAAGPPVRDFKQLDVRNFVENCTKKRKRAVMDALFDDVQVERQP
jgi:hypothetical protein